MPTPLTSLRLCFLKGTTHAHMVRVYEDWYLYIEHIRQDMQILKLYPKRKISHCLCRCFFYVGVQSTFYGRVLCVCRLPNHFHHFPLLLSPYIFSGTKRKGLRLFSPSSLRERETIESINIQLNFPRSHVFCIASGTELASLPTTFASII